jgi:quercetin dioxygenase-like cupin family protein
MKSTYLLSLLGALGLATAAVPEKTALLGSAAVSWEEIQTRAPKGLSRQVFRAPTATLDELELHVTTLAPGEAPHPPHKHPDEEIIIIKEGVVEVTVNGETRRVGPGDRKSTR